MLTIPRTLTQSPLRLPEIRETQTPTTALLRLRHSRNHQKSNNLNPVQNNAPTPGLRHSLGRTPPMRPKVQVSNKPSAYQAISTHLFFTIVDIDIFLSCIVRVIVRYCGQFLHSRCGAAKWE